MTLAIPVAQALQVLTVLIAAPGINGVIARVEARLQGRHGPRVLQPYFDIAKFAKRRWRRRGELNFPRRSADRDDVLSDRAIAHPGADHVSSAAGLYVPKLLVFRLGDAVCASPYAAWIRTMPPSQGVVLLNASLRACS
jgi:hypothetical protein